MPQFKERQASIQSSERNQTEDDKLWVQRQCTGKESNSKPKEQESVLRTTKQCNSTKAQTTCKAAGGDVQDEKGQREIDTLAGKSGTQLPGLESHFFSVRAWASYSTFHLKKKMQ